MIRPKDVCLWMWPLFGRTAPKFTTLEVNPVVLPLTHELARIHGCASRRCLVGDGSCSLDNMQQSCFASERCQNGLPVNMSLLDYVHTPHSYIAVSGSRFCGCVVAQPFPSAFWIDIMGGDVKMPDGALFLSNLCVDSELRNQRVGRALIDSVLALGRPTYLTVSKGRGRSEFEAVFAERVKRLCETYSRCGFEQVGESAAYIMFRFGRNET